MQLYYHQTDGGAEYYCVKHVEGCDEGDATTAILRTDGDEIEVYVDQILKYCNKLITKNLRYR